MTTDPALIEQPDASILLTACPQRLGALADTLHLTHEDAMGPRQANGLTVFTLGGAERVAGRALPAAWPPRLRPGIERSQPRPAPVLGEVRPRFWWPREQVHAFCASLAEQLEVQIDARELSEMSPLSIVYAKLVILLGGEAE